MKWLVRWDEGCEDTFGEVWEREGYWEFWYDLLDEMELGRKVIEVKLIEEERRV